MWESHECICAPPPPSACPPFQPGRCLTFFTFLIFRLHPSVSSLSSRSSPLLLRPLFTLIFHHSPRLPIPLFRGPVRYAREEFARLLLPSEDVASKNQYNFHMSYPWTRDADERKESRELRHKDEKARPIFPAATTPPSLITPLLPFYLLSPCPHLCLFPLLSVPWERTEKKQGGLYVSLCTSLRSMTAASPQEHFSLFILTTLLSMPWSAIVYHTIHKVLLKKLEFLGYSDSKGWEQLNHESLSLRRVWKRNERERPF